MNGLVIARFAAAHQSPLGAWIMRFPPADILDKRNPYTDS
jgi:hypothetical protein